MMPDNDLVMISAWQPCFKISDDGTILLGCSDYYNELTRLGTAPSDLVVPRGVISIKEYAFSYPMDPMDPSTFDDEYTIRSLILPEGLTHIGYAAIRLRLMETISLPSTIKKIDGSGLADCEALKSITLPEGLEVLEIRALQNCYSLKSANIPSTVQKLSNCVFTDDESLVEVNISNGVVDIGEEAFLRCSALPSITIPNSVATIGINAFKGCTSLTSINIDKPANSITGAPWSAPNATVNWLR